MALKDSADYLILMTAYVVLASSTYCRAAIGDCDNSGEVIFNCSGVGLEIIPSEEHVPNYYETLDFSNNQIRVVSRLNYSSDNAVITLILANNQIKLIEPNAFVKMTNLLTLDVSGNSLDGRNIEEKQFNDLQKLQMLNMSRNPMERIGEDTFSFLELASLAHLDLSHCNINQIEDGAIDLPHLKYLDLSWNKLTRIHKDSFRMLVDLNTLDLSHNQLTMLDQVPYLPEIKVLNLDHNLISYVSVREEIRNLADSLERMYIRNNSIEQFTFDSFPLDLESIKGIHLDSNPIKCDCHMKWIAKDKTFRNRNFAITCHNPPEHRGKNLLTIPHEDLTCGTPVYTIVLLVTLSMVVGMCFMLLMYFVLRRKKSQADLQMRMQIARKNKYTAVCTNEEDEDDSNTLKVSDTRMLLRNGKKFEV